MHRIEELVSARRPTGPSVALGPVGCILTYHDLEQAGQRQQIGRVMRLTHHWAATHKPESYTLNLRWGPAAWLASCAIHQGVPVHAVVARGQLEKQPSDVQDHLLYLWHSAATQRMAGTPQERDALITGEVHCLTLDEILKP